MLIGVKGLACSRGKDGRNSNRAEEAGGKPKYPAG